MRIDYDKFLKQFCVRNLRTLINLKLSNFENFYFPINTAIHHVSFEKNDLILNPDLEFLNFNKKLFLTLIKNHPETNDFKIKETIYNEIFNTLRKDYSKRYKVVKEGTNVIVSSLYPIVYEYSSVRNMINTFSTLKLTDYYITRFMLQTFVDKINSMDFNLNNFIIIKLPETIPSYKNFKRFEDDIIKPVTVRTFTEYEDLVLLDLWNFINIEKRNDFSIFSKINKDKLNKVNLMFIKNNIISIFPLNILESLNKESDLDNKNKLSTLKLRKLFWFYINNIYKASIFGMDVIKDELNNNFLKTNDKNELFKSLKDIDNTILEEDDELEEFKDEEVEDKIIEDVVEDVEENEDIEIDDDYIIKINTEEDIIEKVKLKLKLLEQTKVMNKKETESLLKTLEEQEVKESPFKDGSIIKDNLLLTEKDLELPDTKIVPDDKIIFDKSNLNYTTKVMDKKYIKEVMKKDIVGSIYSLQNADLVIKDYKIEKNESILGEYEEHIITIKPLDGKEVTLKFRLPVVDENGNFKISGMTYVFRKQRMDYPIRKVDTDKVNLVSYYGKVFLNRSKYTKNNKSYKLFKQINKIYLEENSIIKQIVTNNVSNSYMKVPYHYELYNKYIKILIIKNNYFYFNYEDRESILPDNINLKDIEKNKYVLIGLQNNKDPILMDFDNKFYLYKNNKYIEIDGIDKLLNIDIYSIDPDVITVKILRFNIPLVYLLLYYTNFNFIVKKLKTKYRLEDVNKRSTLENYEYVIKFKDKKLILDGRDIPSSILLKGLDYYKDIKTIDFEDLNNKNILETLLLKNGLSIIAIREFELLNSLFIDPITKSILKSRNDPITFIGLLFKSIDLLKDSYYKDEQDLTEMLIKGYETFSGIIYKSMVESIRDYRNKNLYGKAKLTLDPFKPWAIIGQYSMLEEDLNPLSSLKLREDSTYLGINGKTKETISKSSRAYHISEIGIISEAHKDSGDVGISAYLSSNPKFNTVRGNKGNFNFEEDGWNSILSTSAMLAPGILHDDPKRANFKSIQDSHTIPIANLEVPYILTGYEAVLPYKLPTSFINIAEEDGKVIKKTKNKLIVEYKTLGKKEYSLNVSTTKEESSSCFSKTMVTNLETDSTFNKDDVLTYVKEYFKPNPFNPKKVLFTQTTNLKVALLEVSETHEDSCAISSNVTNKLGIEYFKVKSFIVDFTHNVIDIAKIGQKINPEDNLLVLDSTSEDIYKDLDEETKKILSNFKRTAPKAKINGVIEKIKIYYNGELEDMTSSLREVIEEANKRLQAEMNNNKITGKVNGEFGIKGKSINKNVAYFKFYIRVKEEMGIGDKGVFANQMKTTVGEIFEDKIVDEHNNEIEALFSERSIQARIVESPKIIGTTTTLLKTLANKAVEEYKK